MKRLIVPALTVLMVLAGCAGQAPGGSPNPDAPPMMGVPTGGESAALGLVNLWHVSGAEGEAEATWLRLDDQEFQLWRDCGMISGSWQATDTLFLGGAWGGMGDCVMTSMPHVGWIEAAVGFLATGTGYDLVDRDGSVVASLSIDGAPEPIPTAAEFYAQPPEITEKTREHFGIPASLPSGLVPASARELEGTWVPVGFTGDTNPHVLFSADGTWTGSDGCNAAQGRWAVGPDGEFLAAAGPQTLIGCDGAPVASWVSSAKSAGVDGEGWLLLFDAAGTEIGRLER